MSRSDATASAPSDPQPAPDFDLQAFFPYRIAVVAALVSRRLADLYGKRFGLTVAEWRALAHLSQEGRISIRDLHRRIDLDKPSATRACQRLADRGLVAKATNPDDRRLLALSLTDAGAAMVAEISALGASLEAELLADLPEATRHGLDEALDLLRSALEPPAGGA